MTGRIKPMYSMNDLPHCHFVHQKFNMNYPRAKPRVFAVGRRNPTT